MRKVFKISSGVIVKRGFSNRGCLTDVSGKNFLDGSCYRGRVCLPVPSLFIIRAVVNFSCFFMFLSQKIVEGKMLCQQH